MSPLTFEVTSDSSPTTTWTSVSNTEAPCHDAFDMLSSQSFVLCFLEADWLKRT